MSQRATNRPTKVEHAAVVSTVTREWAERAHSRLAECAVADLRTTAIGEALLKASTPLYRPLHAFTSRALEGWSHAEVFQN